MHRELVELPTLGSVMVGVAIIGAGQTKYGNHDLGLKGMWAESARNALSSIDQNFDAKLIEEAYIFLHFHPKLKDHPHIFLQVSSHQEYGLILRYKLLVQI